jgi:CheY-like chemotaxis protein
MLIGPRIVVYDDEPLVALELASMLGDAGYDNVQTASDSKIALAALEQWPPIDLLVSDIVNPDGLDGIALARIARQRHPFIRVIFVSGYASRPLERAIGWPILVKPVYPKAFVAQVNSALGVA